MIGGGEMNNIIVTQKKIIGTISNKYVISAVISDAGKISATLHFPELVSSAKPYEGEYVITPSTDTDQILNTKNTFMESDVTVLKIPTYETSNEAGKTFIIGD